MTKTIKTLFTLSVVLNVLMLGAAGGIAIKKYHESDWYQAQKDLTPQGQKLMVASFKKMRLDMEPLMAEVQKTRLELKKVLSDEQFDEAKFDEITSHMKDVRQQMGDKFTADAKTFVANLSPDERKKVAERFVNVDWQHRAKTPFWTCPTHEDGKDNPEAAPESGVNAGDPGKAAPPAGSDQTQPSYPPTNQ